MLLTPRPHNLRPLPPDTYLDIITPVSNPIRYNSRIRLARAAIEDWLLDPNVRVHIGDCPHGIRQHELEDFPARYPGRAFHYPLRATTPAWQKESIINEVQRRMHVNVAAKYIGMFDADIHFRKPGFGAEIIHALQLHPIVQPWTTAYDLGPNDEHIQAHSSFALARSRGQPLVSQGKPNFWKFANGPYDYPHPGFAWAVVAEFFDWLGGLIDCALMGSGDHHMALGLVGLSEYSMPGQVTPEYRNMVSQWEARAIRHLNYNVGLVHGTIEHHFHGRKSDRRYVPRWDMFERHKFNPLTDVKHNRWGILEFAGNKPELIREWVEYLRIREEDVNTLS